MTERPTTVQVPVSLIEKVILALRPGTPQFTRQARTDALRALLSQPTPTAEPVLPARAVAAVMDTYDNGDGECEPEDRWRLFRDMRSLLASEQVVVPAPAEPHRIEDMAPGTTFEYDSVRWEVREEQDGSRYAVDDDGRILHHAIDPSTIRDVTPPAGA